MSNIFLSSSDTGDIFENPALTRSKLGLVFGNTIQSHNVKLDNLSNLTLGNNQILKTNGNNGFEVLNISTHGENALNSTSALLTSGDINIPQNTSDLTNDSNFITNSTNAFSYNNLSNKPSIPTNTSDLTNDSNFLTASDSTINFSGDIRINNDPILTRSGTAAMTNKTFSTDNNSVNSYQTSDGAVYTFDFFCNTNDEFKFNTNVSNYITNIFTVNYNNAILSFNKTPKIGTNNILHANDNISELTNDTGFITDTANAFNYNNLSNKPDLSNYITDTADAFNYNNLSNIPTNLLTINTTQDITSAKTVKNNLVVDQNNSGELQFYLNSGLPPSNKITKLVAVEHASTSSPITLSLPSVKSGSTSDQLVSLNAIQTLTGKTLDYNSNTFQNFPEGDVTADSTTTFTNKSMSYDQLTGTPTIPDVSNFITLSSAGNLTNKSMEIPNNSNLYFKKADTNNTDARIYYDTNDTFKIGNLLTDWISVTDTNVMTFGVTPKIGSDNILHANDNISQLNNNSGFITRTLGSSTQNDFTFSSYSAGMFSAPSMILRNQATTDGGWFGLYNDGGTDPNIIINNNGKVAINATNPEDFLTVRHPSTATSTLRGIGLEDNGSSIKWRVALSGAGGEDDCYMIMFDNADTQTVQIHTNNLTYFNGGKMAVGATSCSSSVMDIRGPGASDTVYIFSDHSTRDFRWRFRYDEIEVQRETGTNNNTYGNTAMFVNHNGGSVIIGGSAVTSDSRIKHNEVDITNGIEIIKKLKPQKYFKTTKVYGENHNYILDESGNPITEDSYRIETGLIAQDIQQIPELAHLVKEIPDKSRTEKEFIIDEDGNDVLDENNEKTFITKEISVPSRLCLNYQDIFVYNIKAVQELIKKVELLEEKIVELENRTS